MSKWVPFVSVELQKAGDVSPQMHLAELMQAYRFDKDDLLANRAGQITARQRQELKTFDRNNTRSILIVPAIFIALPLLSQVVSAIPSDVILVSAVAVPLLVIWLLITPIRRALAGNGRFMMLEAYCRMDTDSTVRIGTTAYTYLYQTGEKAFSIMRSIGLVRRGPSQISILQPKTVYRVYYFKRGSFSYILAIEPLIAPTA
jgi:hypothetical protein